MATSSRARRFFSIPSLPAAAFAAAALVLPTACSSSDADDAPAAAGAGTSAGGTGNHAGTSALGGGSARGGTGGGAGAVPSNVGGTSASVGGSSANAAGTSSHPGGSPASLGGSSSSSGGSVSTGGKGGRADPPTPNDDGSSPYERECHGDTIECNDVDVLRCLGIRDDNTIYGYSCSNTCETDADCSAAPASGESQAGCVDFVTQKHCLLVCLSDGKMHSCPDGMGCYVYPQSPIGYCLWQ